MLNIIFLQADVTCVTSKMRDARKNCVNFPLAASTIVFELLFNSKANSYYVSVNYDGKALGVGCGIYNEACSLESFLKLIDSKVVNLGKSCLKDDFGQAVSDSYRGGLLILFIFLGLFTIVMILILFIWRRSRRWKSIEEQSLRKYEIENQHDANQI
jgi:hypothetical protein